MTNILLYLKKHMIDLRWEVICGLIAKSVLSISHFRYWKHITLK